jgi:hypothetical protein
MSEFRDELIRAIATNFIHFLEQIESQTGTRRDVVIDGVELGLKELREKPPMRQLQ